MMCLLKTLRLAGPTPDLLWPQYSLTHSAEGACWGTSLAWRWAAHLSPQVGWDLVVMMQTSGDMVAGHMSSHTQRWTKKNLSFKS